MGSTRFFSHQPPDRYHRTSRQRQRSAPFSTNRHIYKPNFRKPRRINPSKYQVTPIINNDHLSTNLLPVRHHQKRKIQQLPIIRNMRPLLNTRPYPGANMKLDYSGWIPTQRKRNVEAILKQLDAKNPTIVTLESVIQAAPIALSDNLEETNIASVNLQQELENAIFPVEDIPVLPYIPSTFDSLYENTLIAPAYEAPAPTYEPILAVPQKKSIREQRFISFKDLNQNSLLKPYVQNEGNIMKPSNGSVQIKSDIFHKNEKDVFINERDRKVESDAKTAQNSFTVNNSDFPVYEDIITAESDIPDEEKYVSFSFARNEKDEAKGEVTNNPRTYNIFYEDPLLELSYGEKYPKMRKAKIDDVPVISHKA